MKDYQPQFLPQNKRSMTFSASTQLIPKVLNKKLYKFHATPSYQRVTSLNEIVTRDSKLQNVNLNKGDSLFLNLVRLCMSGII